MLDLKKFFFYVPLSRGIPFARCEGATISPKFRQHTRGVVFPTVPSLWIPQYEKTKVVMPSSGVVTSLSILHSPTSSL